MSESATTVPPYIRLKDGAPFGSTELNDWDAWAVTPTGDEAEDYKTGAKYADLALDEVIAKDNPGGLTLTLTTIFTKIINGEIPPGPMEKGFIDCLARRAADQRAQMKAN